MTKPIPDPRPTPEHELTRPDPTLSWLKLWFLLKNLKYHKPVTDPTPTRIEQPIFQVYCWPTMFHRGSARMKIILLPNPDQPVSCIAIDVLVSENHGATAQAWNNHHTVIPFRCWGIVIYGRTFIKTWFTTIITFVFSHHLIEQHLNFMHSWNLGSCPILMSLYRSNPLLSSIRRRDGQRRAIFFWSGVKWLSTLIICLAARLP